VLISIVVLKIKVARLGLKVVSFMAEYETDVVEKFTKRVNVLFDTSSFGVLLVVVEVECVVDGFIEVNPEPNSDVLAIAVVVQLKLFNLRPDGSHVIC
jgi:hypothetical protein